MLKRFGVLVSAANMAAVVAVACGGAAAPTATTAPAAPAAAATATQAAPSFRPTTPTPGAAAAAPTAAPVGSSKPSGRVTVSDANAGGTPDLDPGSWQASQRGLYRVIYEPLMYMNPDGSNYLSPILAESWEMAKDGLSWTFHLRKGVKFQNGEDFDAQVMAKNMKRARGLQSGFFHDNTAGYEFPDSHTLLLKLKKPDLGLLSRLVYGSRIGYPAPSKYIDEAGAAEIGLSEANRGLIRRAPIGTGPYKIVKFDTQTPEIVVEAWEEWGGYWGYRPTVKTVRYIGIPEETTRIAAVATGEIDIASLAAGPQLKEIRGGTVHLTTSVRVAWLEFFQQALPDSVYSNLKVRQAMNYAVDKNAIIDKLLGGAAVISATSISPLQFGFPKDLKPYPYDPQKAKQLLQEAGYPDGFDGGVIITISAAERVQSQAIAAYLADVGVKVRIESMDSATRSRRWIPPVHDLYLVKGMGWLGSSLAGDGDYRIESFFTKYGQWGYTVDPALDALYDKTLGTVDNSERERTLQQLATMTNEKAYKLFLWFPKTIYAWGPRIADWKLTPGEDQPDGFQTLRLK